MRSAAPASRSGLDAAVAKRGRPRLVDDAMREVVLSGFRWLTLKTEHGAPLTARAAIVEISERLGLAKGTVPRHHLSAEAEAFR